MNILLYEQCTAALALNPNLSSGLLHEGQLMVRALARDGAELTQHVMQSLQHERAVSDDFPLAVRVVREQDKLSVVWQEALHWADAVLAVAPETNGALLSMAQEVLAAHKIWLGCAPTVIALTASKYATSQTLNAAGVPAVRTFNPAQEACPAENNRCWVVKPDDGCGCEGQVVFDSVTQAWNYALSATPSLMVQPWLEGDALSLSLLCREDRMDVLSVNQQQVKMDAQHQPALTGLVVNAAPVSKELQDWAQQVVQALPGLRGLVGVDYIQTKDGPVVLEINPRATTSYAGLRAAMAQNPLRCWLQNEPWQWVQGARVLIHLKRG